ncbi:MAG: hypothetical protein CR993_00890 [Rhodobacterales bacterium]|nr:MAG: hypothetical protein CR993_00890 [Rhodobacterales bacterium]
MRILTLTAAALTATALPLFAGSTKGDYVHSQGGAAREEEPARAPDGGEQVDPRQRFVDSNIVETLYHELAHALIDVLDLPVLGPEEWAADFFANVMINRMFSEDEIVAMTYDIAAAYDAGARKENSAGSGPSMWDTHGADRQRYFNLVCHMYGANPEEREDLAEELDLPDARAEVCEEEYELAARSWNRVLSDLAETAPGDGLHMDWIMDRDSHLTKHVSAEVDRLNQTFNIPEPISVSVIPCEEVNAYYDPHKREIQICTELEEHLAQLAP